MNYFENKILTELYSKMINEDRRGRRSDVLQSILNKDAKIEHWIKEFGKAYREFDGIQGSEPDKYLNQSLVNILRLKGINDVDIPFVNIYEIFLNTEDVGRPIEDSIQGFEDPNNIFSPEEILRFKLKFIEQDLDNNALQDAYYFHESDPELMLKPVGVPLP